MLLSAIGQVGNGERPIMCWTASAPPRSAVPVAIGRDGTDGRLGSLLKDVDVRRRRSSSWAADTVPPLVRVAMTLVERAGLWTEDRKVATREAERRMKAGEMSVVRLGLRRSARHPARQDDRGVGSRRGAEERRRLHDDDAAEGHVASDGLPVWQPGGGLRHEGAGGRGDVVMLPDPTTFRALPWAPHSGWMLCDIYFADGPADATLHAPYPGQDALDPGRSRLRFRRRPGSRVPSVQA